jgi:hypothetical protein
MTYQDRIQQIAPQANARHIEAWLRLEHPTLDHLSADRFKHEVRVALDCIAEGGAEQSEQLAQSFGL